MLAFAYAPVAIRQRFPCNRTGYRSALDSRVGCSACYEAGLANCGADVRESDLQDFTRFLSEFQGETDRGAALVGAALIDLRLSNTLRAFMVSPKAAADLLNRGTAALGPFSSRIKATFALGLIDKHERGECDLIRKVRNEFAHQAHGLTFDDPKIMTLCDKLQSDLPGGREAHAGKPRFVFINAVILTVMRLTYRAERVAAERRETRTWS